MANNNDKAAVLRGSVFVLLYYPFYTDCRMSVTELTQDCTGSNLGPVLPRSDDQ
jgi:hypothetical protein